MTLLPSSPLPHWARLAACGFGQTPPKGLMTCQPCSWISARLLRVLCFQQRSSCWACAPSPPSLTSAVLRPPSSLVCRPNPHSTVGRKTTSFLAPPYLSSAYTSVIATLGNLSLAFSNAYDLQRVRVTIFLNPPFDSNFVLGGTRNFGYYASRDTDRKHFTFEQPLMIHRFHRDKAIWQSMFLLDGPRSRKENASRVTPSAMFVLSKPTEDSRSWVAEGSNQNLRKQVGLYCRQQT